ncbi:hypothetical protein HC891_10125 [Candidatus Gracilibacteria bacterium]|nr:hypothetical protein [Candidatus Gracilibacteria bacterium]
MLVSGGIAATTGQHKRLFGNLVERRWAFRMLRPLRLVLWALCPVLTGVAAQPYNALFS